MSLPIRPSGQYRTLADAVLTDALGRQRDLLLVLAFGTLMGALAQISIPLPFTPVPITGQTLGVLLVGALLGSRRGAAAMLLYLAEGAAGLPVFSEARSGATMLVGPTGGYLLAFPIAAFAVGWLSERGWDRQFFTAAAAMLIGSVIIYAGGLTVLSYYVGLERAIPLGMLPFLPGDTIKLIVAALALPGGWRLLSMLGMPTGER